MGLRPSSLTTTPRGGISGAWQRGWPTVFVSAARVLHRHRATTSKYYSSQQLQAMVVVNYLRFLASTVSSQRLFRELWSQAIWRLFARVAGSRPPWMRMGPLQRFLAAKGGDLIGKIRGRELDVNSAAIAMSSLSHHYSSARAESDLGYAIRPLEGTVRDAWEWFRKYGYV